MGLLVQQLVMAYPNALPSYVHLILGLPINATLLMGNKNQVHLTVEVQSFSPMHHCVCE